MTRLILSYFRVGTRRFQESCDTAGIMELCKTKLPGALRLKGPNPRANAAAFIRKHDCGCSQTPAYSEPSHWWEPCRTIPGVCTCAWPTGDVAIESGGCFYRYVEPPPSKLPPDFLTPRRSWRDVWRSWRRPLAPATFFEWVFFDLPPADPARHGEEITLTATKCGAQVVPRGLTDAQLPELIKKVAMLMHW